MLLNRTILLATLVAALAPRATNAQIYRSVDANGTIRLSDRKPNGGTILEYAVPGAPTYRATKPVSAGAGRWDALVQQHATTNALRPELVRAVIQVESGFNPRATSPKGAMGLMQLMPQTARELGVQNAYDPDQNIRGGTRYLRMLLDKYRGNEDLALAAYNAGSGAVAKYGEKIPPYRETKDYVRKVGSAAGARTPAVEQARGRRAIYKFVEVINGRPVQKFSDSPPSQGAFEVINR